MADSDGKGSENDNFQRNNSRSQNEDDNAEEDNSQGASIGPDIGLGNIRQVRRSSTENGLAG